MSEFGLLSTLYINRFIMYFRKLICSVSENNDSHLDSLKSLVISTKYFCSDRFLLKSITKEILFNLSITSLYNVPVNTTFVSGKRLRSSVNRCSSDQNSHSLVFSTFTNPAECNAMVIKSNTCSVMYAFLSTIAFCRLCASNSSRNRSMDFLSKVSNTLREVTWWTAIDGIIFPFEVPFPSLFVLRCRGVCGA